MEYRKLEFKKDWLATGEGLSSVTYCHKNDSRILLKLFKSAIIGKDHAAKEFNFSKAVEACGITTPKAIEVVEVNGKYGVIYERITNKISFSRLCGKNDDDMKKYAKEFAEEAKALHATNCVSDLVISRKSEILKIAQKHDGYNKTTKKLVEYLCDSYEDTKTCLHGDLHTGNLIKAYEKNYWIDIGTFAYGNPIFDIASTYFYFKRWEGRPLAKKSLHMNKKQLLAFWDVFAESYVGSSDKEKIAEFEKKAEEAVVLYFVLAVSMGKFAGRRAKLYDMSINSFAKKIAARLNIK